MNLPAIDTNLLVFASTEKSIFYLKAKVFLENFLEKKGFIIAQQSLYELYTVLTRKHAVSRPLSSKEALRIYNFYLNHPHVKVVCACEKTPFTIQKILKKTPVKGRAFFDVVLAATFVDNGIKTLYTHNVKDFKYFSCFTVKNPLD